jgi:UDP-N-acetylglucosamine acyltransferase
MIGGLARVVKDVPPYVTVDAKSGYIVGLNLVGLKRSGFNQDDILQLKQAYRVIYRSGLRWPEVLQVLQKDFSSGPAAEFHRFFSGGVRGFTPERRMPRSATIRLPLEAQAAATPVAPAKAG